MTGHLTHNTEIDLTAFFDSIARRYVGMDSGDLNDFMARPCHIHTFMLQISDPSRMGEAMSDLLSDPSASGLVESCTGMMVYILRSPNMARPLLTSDISALSDWLNTLPNEIEVMWGLADYPEGADGLRLLLIMRLE